MPVHAATLPSQCGAAAGVTPPTFSLCPSLPRHMRSPRRLASFSLAVALCARLTAPKVVRLEGASPPPPPRRTAERLAECTPREEDDLGSGGGGGGGGGGGDCSGLVLAREANPRTHGAQSLLRPPQSVRGIRATRVPIRNFHTSSPCLPSTTLTHLHVGSVHPRPVQRSQTGCCDGLHKLWVVPLLPLHRRLHVAKPGTERLERCVGRAVAAGASPAIAPLTSIISGTAEWPYPHS
jgi:hypothetical protein